MELIKQSHEILHLPVNQLQLIELAGRTCYLSQDKTTDESAKEFCGRILNRGHESVIEHGYVTVKFVTNRAITHELVRHRLASFSQQSTRYVDHKEHMEFIIPFWCENIIEGNTDLTPEEQVWYDSMENAEFAYKELRRLGWPPQKARGVLPNDLKTEIVMTANLREWRHVFKLRTSKAAHPQMQELMCPLLEEFQKQIPIMFEDI